MQPETEATTSSEPQHLQVAVRCVVSPASAEAFAIGGRAMHAVAMFSSAVFSLILHGGIAAAMILWFEPRPGFIASPTEAISVELVASEVLEDVQATPSKEAAASAHTVHSDGGAEQEASRSPEPAVMPFDPSKDVPPMDETTSKIPTPLNESATASLTPSQELADEHAPVAQDLSPPKIQKPRTVQPKPREEARPQLKEKRPDSARKKQAQRKSAQKGGERSRVNVGSARTSGRVSASSGSMVNYAAIVRARVAAQRPAGPGRTGTVIVTFGVGQSGALKFVNIARSSGDAGLDRMVLAAVRRASPFPAAPPGASAAQLRFSMPFHFQ